MRQLFKTMLMPVAQRWKCWKRCKFNNNTAICRIIHLSIVSPNRGCITMCIDNGAVFWGAVSVIAVSRHLPGNIKFVYLINVFKQNHFF